MVLNYCSQMLCIECFRPPATLLAFMRKQREHMTPCKGRLAKRSGITSLRRTFLDSQSRKRLEVQTKFGKVVSFWPAIPGISHSAQTTSRTLDFMLQTAQTLQKGCIYVCACACKSLIWGWGQ